MKEYTLSEWLSEWFEVYIIKNFYELVKFCLTTFDKQDMPTSIRLNKDLYNQISEEAKKEKRSISKQIDYMLTKYLEIRDKMRP